MHKDNQLVEIVMVTMMRMNVRAIEMSIDKEKHTRIKKKRRKVAEVETTNTMHVKKKNVMMIMEEVFLVVLTIEKIYL